MLGKCLPPDAGLGPVIRDTYGYPFFLLAISLRPTTHHNASRDHRPCTAHDVGKAITPTVGQGIALPPVARPEPHALPATPLCATITIHAAARLHRSTAAPQHRAEAYGTSAEFRPIIKKGCRLASLGCLIARTRLICCLYHPVISYI